MVSAPGSPLVPVYRPDQHQIPCKISFRQVTEQGIGPTGFGRQNLPAVIVHSKRLGYFHILRAL